MPTVAGAMQGGGTSVCLGITLGPIFQQELAYSIVPIAAGIVLQGTETKVTQQKQAGDRGGERREHWPQNKRPEHSRGYLHQLAV